MSAPWMSREPFVLLEDEPAEDADTAEGQHHHRRRCSRREQLSVILAVLACLSSTLTQPLARSLARSQARSLS